VAIYTIKFKRDECYKDVPEIHVDADFVDLDHRLIRFCQYTGVKDSRGQVTHRTVRFIAPELVADIKMRNAWRIESLMDDTVFEKPLKPKRTVLGKKKSKGKMRWEGNDLRQRIQE